MIVPLRIGARLHQSLDAWRHQSFRRASVSAIRRFALQASSREVTRRSSSLYTQLIT
jgi:hypothetical protein